MAFQGAKLLDMQVLMDVMAQVGRTTERMQLDIDREPLYPYEWVRLINETASYAIGEEAGEYTNTFRREMVVIAATAILAVEAFDKDRKVH